VTKVLTDEVIDRVADAIIAIQGQENPMIPSIKEQLRVYDKGLKNLLKAIEAGIFTPTTKERMEELERQGKQIPEDVAVTGYDNSLYARQGQGITTITHPQEKLGEMAAKLLLEKLSGVPDEESKVERLIRPELIVRGSSVKTGI